MTRSKTQRSSRLASNRVRRRANGYPPSDGWLVVLPSSSADLAVGRSACVATRRLQLSVRAATAGWKYSVRWPDVQLQPGQRTWVKPNYRASLAALAGVGSDFAAYVSAGQWGGAVRHGAPVRLLSGLGRNRSSDCPLLLRWPIAPAPPLSGGAWTQRFALVAHAPSACVGNVGVGYLVMPSLRGLIEQN